MIGANFSHPEEKLLADAMRPWSNQVRGLIDRRFADARSHVAGGRLTEAHARLDELNQGLASHLSNARAAFYRDSFRFHRPSLDPKIHLMDEGPTADGAAVARLVKIGDRDVYADIGKLVDQAKLSLTIASNAIGDSRVQSDLRDSILSAWEVTHRDGLQRFVRGELSNSQTALFQAVGRILIRPELR